MARGVKLSQEEAAARIAERGYVLLGQYRRKDEKVLVRCEKHSFEKEVEPGHLFRGAIMACCCREASSERGKLKIGEKNNFFGRSHSIETREKISRHHLKSDHAFRGKPRPAYLTNALLRSITGVPRTKPVRDGLRAHMLKRHKDFDYCVSKTLVGRTAGKAGWFYVVRVGEYLKFGSATTTMAYRLTRHRQKYGADVELLLQCAVSNCGSYEAAMMQAHKGHWSHGEFFKDFLSDGMA